MSSSTKRCSYGCRSRGSASAPSVYRTHSYRRAVRSCNRGPTRTMRVHYVHEASIEFTRRSESGASREPAADQPIRPDHHLPLPLGAELHICLGVDLGLAKLCEAGKKGKHIIGMQLTSHPPPEACWCTSDHHHQTKNKRRPNRPPQEALGDTTTISPICTEQREHEPRMQRWPSDF
jgi:hypothetical protein